MENIERAGIKTSYAFIRDHVKITLDYIGLDSVQKVHQPNFIIKSHLTIIISIFDWFNLLNLSSKYVGLEYSAMQSFQTEKKKLQFHQTIYCGKYKEWSTYSSTSRGWSGNHALNWGRNTCLLTVRDRNWLKWFPMRHGLDFYHKLQELSKMKPQNSSTWLMNFKSFEFSRLLFCGLWLSYSRSKSAWSGTDWGRKKVNVFNFTKANHSLNTPSVSRLACSSRSSNTNEEKCGILITHHETISGPAKRKMEKMSVRRVITVIWVVRIFGWLVKLNEKVLEKKNRRTKIDVTSKNNPHGNRTKCYRI